MTQLFTPLDLAGLACFLAAWIGYAVMIEWTPHGRASLNAAAMRFSSGALIVITICRSWPDHAKHFHHVAGVRDKHLRAHRR